jgi:hypothetical protein
MWSARKSKGERGISSENKENKGKITKLDFKKIEKYCQ